MLTVMYKVFDKFTKLYNTNRLKKYTNNKSNVKCLGRVSLINKNIKLGENVVIYPNVSFEGNGIIEIGNNVKIGTNTILYADKNGGLKIGDNTIIAGNNYIIDSNHNIRKADNIINQGLYSSKIEIGSDVWIGTNCSIICGAKINDGVVIGANSLVNKEISPYMIAFGTPATEVKVRE